MSEIKNTSNGLCRFLKSKSPFGNLQGGPNQWIITNDPNLISWCGRSMNGMGPDNGAVDPKKCIPGRSCYKTRE